MLENKSLVTKPILLLTKPKIRMILLINLDIRLVQFIYFMFDTSNINKSNIYDIFDITVYLN